MPTNTNDNPEVVDQNRLRLLLDRAKELGYVQRKLDTSEEYQELPVISLRLLQGTRYIPKDGE